MRATAPVWGLFPTLSAALVVLPVLALAGRLTGDTGEVVRHLVATVLGRYLINTAALVALVAAITLILGVPTAWLTTWYHFPGSRLLRWALLLPLALPAYIAAYTYSGIFDFTGPWQRFFRDVLQLAPGGYPTLSVSGLPGAAIILGVVLYPYTYALTRASLARQSAAAVEVARSLGAGPIASLIRVSLPLARPGLISGTALVMMEVLNEYGAVHYLGVDTFVTGIFRVWFGMSSPGGAVFLALLLLAGVATVALLELLSRRNARFGWKAAAFRPIQRMRLTGWRGATATAVCLFPLLAGFLIPVSQLVAWAWRTAPRVVDLGFLRLVAVTFGSGLAAAILVCSLAVVAAYAGQLYRGGWARRLAGIGSLGYAIPGAVIALGVITIASFLDRGLGAVGLLGPTTLLFSGTVIALLAGYTIRYFGVAFRTTNAGLRGMCDGLDEASRGLGRPPAATLMQVHIPLLRGTLAIGATLVFVDVVKELPLTLILRPFNFETLAVRAFAYAGNEQIRESAAAALLIVATGLVPSALLERLVARRADDL